MSKHSAPLMQQRRLPFSMPSGVCAVPRVLCALLIAAVPSLAWGQASPNVMTTGSICAPTDARAADLTGDGVLDTRSTSTVMYDGGEGTPKVAWYDGGRLTGE